ncbi:hypothetical protein [Rhodopirellula bahusiensis]|uniref:hypothetical protein n=1 Tax=Rhodopirellula bahusiensis TaxID=2014065 RepID=UPI00117AF615|nr:hypothetical protein [Rhodopirellula bahusiensis]
MSDYYHTESSEENLPLFSSGQTAKETRAAAHEAAKPKHSKRLDQAEAILFDAGPQGCIRHRLGDLMGIPLASVCSIALKLLDAGIAFEVGKRPSPHGKSAAVLVHRDHLHGGASK